MNTPSPSPPGAASMAGPLLRIGSLLSFRPLVYGYSNARVHGLYSRFLTPDQLHSLMAAPAPEAMVELLERTSYREDLVALSLHFKGDDLIELAVSRHFARFSRLLLSFSPAEARPVLTALLGRWDAHNLKVVLLARRQKKTFEQILPYLVLAGSISESALRAAHTAKDGEEVLHILRTSPAGRAVMEGQSGDPHAAERLRRLILSLDSAETLQPLLDELYRLIYLFAMRASGSLSGSDMEEVSRLLRRQADEKNLSTILRLRAVGVKPSEMRHYLVPGSSMPASRWMELAQGGPDLPAIQHLAFRLGWTQALKAYASDSSLPKLEAAMARLSATEGVRTFRRAQLSVGVLAGALLLKEQEMANIRKIVRAKALGLPAAEIENMLVHAHS